MIKKKTRTQTQIQKLNMINKLIEIRTTCFWNNGRIRYDWKMSKKLKKKNFYIHLNSKNKLKWSSLKESKRVMIMKSIHKLNYMIKLKLI